MLKDLALSETIVSYIEAGETSSPTLVLLTGWAQDHRLFKSMIPALEKNFHILVPNYRGHDPRHPLNGDFTAQDLTDDVLAFLEVKMVRDFHIVSHSHGCWINLEICDRLGTSRLDKTVVIDWLMEPHPSFLSQVVEGRDPARYDAARKSMFDEWASATENADVLNHIYEEMPSFGGEMWMRANREIETAYRRWGSPLKRMQQMAQKPDVLHIYSQPLDPDYRVMQERFAAENHWFHPRHLPGKTHFPSLENGPGVAEITASFFLG